MERRQFVQSLGALTIGALGARELLEAAHQRIGEETCKVSLKGRGR